MARNSEWWLRTQDEVFGPVTRDNLLDWARMGRIQPGQDVSADGETWMPATEVDFLDMRWSIDIGDGTPRGPFNKQAAEALLRSGRLPKGSRLVEVAPPREEQTPEVAPAESPSRVDSSAAPAPQAQSHDGGQARELAELRRQLDTLQAGLRAAQARAEEAEKRAADARREAKMAVKAADVAEARLAAVQAESEQKDAALAAARSNADAALAAARNKADAALAAEQNRAKEELAAEQNRAKEELAAEQDRAKKALADAQSRADEALAAAQAREGQTAAELAAKDSALAAKDTALAEKETALAAKDTALAEKDSALAAKDSALKASQEAYEDRIRLLSDEIKRLPPTAQLAADAQAAVYTLMREEANELEAALEAEEKEAEALRLYRRERSARLLARKQEILRRIGTGVEDMTQRALKAHPEDPRTEHMRQELEALRLLQERSALESERKIRDLSAKLRDSDGEVRRLRQQTADITVIYRQLQEAREKLMRREKELMEERQKAEAERQQHVVSQQALVARLSALEMGMPGTTNQSREARSVRLAPWMGLKK